MSKNKRKYDRLTLLQSGTPPIDEAFAVIEVGGKVLRRPIQNISYRGIGIMVEAGDDLLLDGKKELPITLEIENTVAKTTGDITYVGRGVAGVNFISLNEVSRRIISAYLDPRYLGSHLREVAPEQLQDPSQRIYLGINRTRLLLTLDVADSTLVTGFELLFASSYVRQSRNAQLLTGQVGSPFLEVGATMLTTELKQIIFDAKLNYETLEAAQRLLRHAPLAVHLQLQLQARLQTAIDAQ